MSNFAEDQEQYLHDAHFFYFGVSFKSAFLLFLAAHQSKPCQHLTSNKPWSFQHNSHNTTYISAYYLIMEYQAQ